MDLSQSNPKAQREAAALWKKGANKIKMIISTVKTGVTNIIFNSTVSSEKMVNFALTKGSLHRRKYHFSKLNRP